VKKKQETFQRKGLGLKQEKHSRKRVLRGGELEQNKKQGSKNKERYERGEDSIPPVRNGQLLGQKKKRKKKGGQLGVAGGGRERGLWGEELRGGS